MARRGEEIRGSWRPCTRSWARSRASSGAWSASSSRLERERRDAQAQLSEMVRALSAGADTLRRETGELVSALKRRERAGSWRDPAAPGGRVWREWSPTATSSSSRTIRTDRRALRARHARAPARREGDRRDFKVPLNASLAAIKTGAEDPQQRELDLGGRAPCSPDARSH